MARKTIASLELEIAGLQMELTDQRRTSMEQQKALLSERDAWRSKVGNTDAEAQAIDGCVKALDPIVGQWGTIGAVDGGRMQRVLRFLADRYGVTWYEPPALPVPPYEPYNAYTHQGCDATAPMEKSAGYAR